jgi:hypothetical protein
MSHSRRSIPEGIPIPALAIIDAEACGEQPENGVFSGFRNLSPPKYRRTARSVGDRFLRDRDSPSHQPLYTTTAGAQDGVSAGAVRFDKGGIFREIKPTASRL